ncbi:MAG: elongation factor P [Emcibacter sp.]|nr:elongation factor P [Emcibacter sp.]
MKIDGNNIRPGNVIEHQGGLWVAVKTAHTQPGKGGAYLQVELKNLIDGRKLNERFRAAEKVEHVRLEQRNYSFLFENSGMYTFMDIETYDQIELTAEFIGKQTIFLQDGMEVVVESYDESPLSVKLPQNITLEVIESEPVVKGQTATSSPKPAIMENGSRVMVPPFVGVGDRVVVNIEACTYVERAK